MPQSTGWEDVNLSSSGSTGWEDYNPPKQYEEEPSLLRRVMSYDVPLVDITPATNWLGDKYEKYGSGWLANASLNMLPGGSLIRDFITPEGGDPNETSKKFLEESIRNTGQVVSGLSTPSNIIATGASLGAAGAARAGLGALAKGLTWTARGASVPTTVHGAQTVANAEDWQDVGMGLGEVAGGLAGTFEPIPRLRAKTGTIDPKVDIPTPVDTPVTPPTQTPGLTRDVIVKSNWTPGEVKHLKNNGYVSGGISPEGLPYMIRKGVEDPYTGAMIGEMDQPTPEQLMDQLRASVEKDQAAASGLDQLPGRSFNADEGFTLPKEEVTSARIDALEAQGFEQVGLTATGDSIFKRFLEDESGGLVTDPQEWMRLIANRGSREILEGESRGRVAQFEQPPMRVPQEWDAAVNQTIMDGPIYPDVPNPALKELEARLGRTPSNEPTLFDYTRPKRVFDEFGDEIPDDFDIQSMARVEGGKAAIGVNVRHSAKELTSGYNRPLPHAMVREGTQNALDAIIDNGDLGNARIEFGQTPEGRNTLSIEDNGKGMNPEELYTVYTDLHSSGKLNQEGATGGKGVGKATYMLGGDHFEVTTVANVNGKKIQSSFRGTPDELLSGFDIESVEVPSDTPTGTKFTTILKEDQMNWNMREAIDNITKYSRNRKGMVDVKKGSYFENERHNLKGNPRDKKVVSNAVIDNGNNKADIFLPEDAKVGTHSSVEVHYLNNGMWQFDERLYLGEEVNGIPDTVVVDLKPQVAELDPNYPFPVQRESVKSNVQSEIHELIKAKLINPFADKKKIDLAKLWQSMQTTPKEVGKTARDTVFFDPGNRLTPEEAAFIEGSETVKYMQSIIDSLLDDILIKLGKQFEQDKLVRTGLSMDPDRYGVHIPNPLAPKAESAIFINPFQHMLDKSPTDAALDTVVTGLHEAAHIGKDQPGFVELQLTPQELQDPRVGRYLQTYLNQTLTQGGVDAGHGLGFIRRLGEIYGKTGADTSLTYADLLESIYTRGATEPGEYGPEIQELLRIYTESRGRAAVTDDILSGTGVKQQSGQGGKGNIPSPPGGSGGGASGGQPPSGRRVIKGRKEPEPPSFLREAYNLPRAATTTMDWSAPLRQGLPLIYRKEWWKSWSQMKDSFGSEAAFQKTLSDLRARPLFQSRIIEGKVIKSFADQAGMKISDLNESLGKREEAVASNWIESGGNLGPISTVYKKTLGRVARASNRAYTAFLNQLRADSFEALLRDAEADFNAGTKGAKNPYTDMTYAKEIADFVNTATGRGPLRTALPSFEGGKIGLKERSLEQNAKLLTDTLFSPRLQASRVRMLNPATYIMASPFVRKQYAKSLFAVASAWGTIASLAAGAGADVSLDPNSADFGKIRIGDTRIDPAGGFQQYLVAASRLISGRPTSSRTGQSQELGQGFRADTRKDVAERFAANKLHPVLKFAYDIAFASEYQPFQVGDRAIQMFVPLIVQDVIELAQQDPNMLPLIGPIAIGMGTQTYGQDERTNSTFINPENDWIFTGGAPESELSNLWGEE